MPSAKKMPAVVLVRPRNPRNIGACARAMANFGFSDLRVVSPHPPVWDEARVSAVGAGTVLEGARVFPTIEAATAERSRVFGFSSMKRRKVSMPVLELTGLRMGRRAAMVFGSEKTGLTSAELEYCDALVRIPTRRECPSMNLGAAVAVACHQLRAPSRGVRDREAADSGAIERLVRDAELALRRVRYRPSSSPEERRSRVRRLLRSRALRKDEAGALAEMLRRLREPSAGAS